ncbi:hypothetical protein F6B93_04200 [Mycobacterium spongiae]|uniref:Uncharacterized protein n=1 Tax=Mycobacterium spongiae TaxID=886343 RepID=A0A975JW24_9MYCO|nr:hypothetical protein [Mycobacterium spongiae]QUR66395.1 hypothetical protein F6B93_04200 [Mycobacterium spongiae]
MFVGSALISIAAGMLSIACHLAGSRPNLVAIGLVISLAAIANQNVFTAAQLWISHYVEPAERIFLIAFGQLVVSAGQIGLSIALGLMAANHDAVWPVVIVLPLNLTAGFAAKRLAPADSVDRGSRTEADGGDHRNR